VYTVAVRFKIQSKPSIKSLTITPDHRYTPRVMTAPQAAFYVGISEATLYKYVRAGKIETKRFEAPESEDRRLDKIVFNRFALDKFVEEYLR